MLGAMEIQGYWEQSLQTSQSNPPQKCPKVPHNSSQKHNSSRVAAGSGSPSAVGSGRSSVQQDDGWLVSDLGVGLEMSSSAGQIEKYSPLFSSTHSTHAVKLSRGGVP